MIATCPSREELEAFSLGKLPDDSIESIAEHLESCPSCEDTVVQFDDRSDTFLENLHGPTPEDPFADESACIDAVSAAKAVAAEPSVADQPPAEAEDAVVGRIGDYQLQAKLGHGGMGTVYRALHTRMRRVVALKVLTTHRRHDPAVVERFGREIEAAGKLSHPNIVTAHDAGEEEGMHYLVMELVEGVDLHALVTQHGPLPVADACEIIRQAALGLQHAHEHGLVHRDLKPSNLMVAVKEQGAGDRGQKSGGRGRESGVEDRDTGVGGRNGEEADSSAFRIPHSAFVKILDLGLARLQGDQVASEDLTATGQVMGTLDYMAPEQADDSHGVDIRSDIYALGCTLYKLLTGHAPFSGESYNSLARKLRGHAEDAPPPIRAARPEVPEALASLIDGMLAKSPDDRPATPVAVAAALEPLCDGCDLPALVAKVDVPAQRDLNAASQAEIAMMVPTPKPSAKNRGRRRLGIFAAVTALMLFVVAAAGIVIAIRRGDGPSTTVEVPEGSEVKIGEDGGVAVSLPGAQSPVAGQAVNGLTVSVSVGSTEWKPGNAIELTCLYKNESSEPIHVPRWGVALPAMEVTKYVDTEVLRDAVPANFVRKMLQLPPAPEVEKQQLWKDIFVEVRPGQAASITRRGVLDKSGQLSIHWPNGAVQTWTLQNGRFHLTAILESRDDDEFLRKLAQEAKFENVWYGKAVSGSLDVTVAGVSPPSAGDDDSADNTDPAAAGNSNALEAQVDRLIEEAGKLLRTNPARGIPPLRAELERIGQLADLDPALRLVLTDKIETTIDKLQGFADRRTKWRADVQAAIAEAKELERTDPHAAARRLRSVSGLENEAVEILFMDHLAFCNDPDLYSLSREYENLARKLDPTGTVKRRLAGEWRAIEVRKATEDAIAHFRADSSSPTRSVDRRIDDVQRLFDRARGLASTIDDGQVQAEVMQEIEEGQRQFAHSIRWGFGNPVVLDSYDASDRFLSGPLDWIHAGSGFVLASQRRAGVGPLDLWRSGEPVVNGELLGPRRLGSVPDATGLLMSRTPEEVRIAQPAGIDGDTLTLRVWNYHLEKPAARPQPFDVKWQLEAPIRPDRAGSAVIHARAFIVTKQGGKTLRIVSLFLRLIDKQAPHRSQLLFVRSTDGGQTWPDPPRLVADDVRWPDAPLRPVCFHSYHVGETHQLGNHLVCLAMDEDNQAVFFRTLDGGEHWTKEFVRLPDPVTGKSVPGIPLASPNPDTTLVYAIPTGDAQDHTYHLCHAWTGSAARSWGGAATIAANRFLPDKQLYAIRATTGDVTAVTCPVAGDRPDEFGVELLLSIDQRNQIWRPIRLDERLGGQVGLTALCARSGHRVFLAAELENSARAERRHQLIVQEIAPEALEFTEAEQDDKQDASSDGVTTNRGRVVDTR